MGRWTYYSPLLIGSAAAALLLATYRQFLPQLPAWQSWLLFAFAAILAGLACQLMMLGAQGAFAQVLPATRGRSVRGGGAMLAGWLIIIGELLVVVALLLAVEGVRLAAFTIGGLALLTLLGAVAAYLWLWPTAVRDFAEES
jgi:hypothetical protein